MKHKNLLVRVVIMLGIFSSFAYARNTYTNEEYGFTMQFPDNWQIKESSQRNTLTKAVRKDESGRIALIAIAAYEVDMDNDVWREVTGEEMFEGLKAEYPNVDVVLSILAELSSMENTPYGLKWCLKVFRCVH